MNFYMLDLSNGLQHHVSDLDALCQVANDTSNDGFPKALQVLYPICRLMEANRRTFNEDIGRKDFTYSCTTVLNQLVKIGIIEASQIEIPPDLNLPVKPGDDGDIAVRLTWDVQYHKGIAGTVLPAQRYQFVVSTKNLIPMDGRIYANHPQP